jgi:hypothetical protein
MATKDLARTVIEGGRSHRNCYVRRRSNAVQRHHERQTSARVARSEMFDEHLYVPRRPVRRDFHDKLSPAKRWLERQVGRPWHKVRSELFSRFDIRTISGRHVVFDHVLLWVSVTVQPRAHAPFYVCTHGLLHRRGRVGRHFQFSRSAR